jgi:ATP-dependent Zn protease
MICDYGMLDDLSLLNTPEDSPRYQRVSEAAGQILQHEMENTLKLLEENRTHLDAVSKALLAKNRLHINDLRGLLPPHPGDGKDFSTPTQNLMTKR